MFSEKLYELYNTMNRKRRADERMAPTAEHVPLKLHSFPYLAGRRTSSTSSRTWAEVEVEEEEEWEWPAKTITDQIWKPICSTRRSFTSYDSNG